MSEINPYNQVSSGDLVICLDTGSVGIVIERQDRNIYLISLCMRNLTDFEQKRFLI